MDLVNLLSKLQAISEADDKKDGKKPEWLLKAELKAEEKDKKEKANEDIENVLRRLQAIQEGKLDEDDVEEGNEFSGELEKAKAAGKKEFEVDGKTYQVKEAEGDAEDRKEDAEGEKRTGMTHKEWEASKEDKEEDRKQDMKEAAECTCEETGEDDCPVHGKEDMDESAGPRKVDVPAFMRKNKNGEDWKTTQQDLEDDKLRNISSSEWLKKQRENGVKESDLSMLRQLAGIKECGDMEMSPMTVVGGEPQMGINPAMPAEVPTIGAQPEAEPAVQIQPEMAEPKASYTLTISNGDSSLNMTTDSPDEIIHVMKLAGIKGDAKVEKQPAGADDQNGSEQKTEESFGNTPAQTNEPNPRLMGDINNWSQKGTGRAPEGSALNKPAGQGDNPMRESLNMLEEYRKFINK